MHSATGRIYLDHNASAPLLAAARNALVDALDVSGNASSVHREGRRARAIVEDARRAVGDLFTCDPDGVVFTSGASEAASTCLSPIWLDGTNEVEFKHLAVLDTDHDCLREGGRFERNKVTRLAVDADGAVLAEALDRWLELVSDRPALLALCLANNETGVVQPIDAYAKAISAPNVTIVLDVVQAVGRIRLDAWASVADALLLSGHKLGAVPGIGAFVLKNVAFRPFPLVRGGGQESYRRAGTEAMPAIASFASAARAAKVRDVANMRSLRNGLELRLVETGATIVGRDAERLPNTSLIQHPALTGEMAAIALDLKGFAVSSGSACSSGKVGHSHVLAAMEAGGCNVDASRGAIRVSIGDTTTVAEIEAFCEAYEALVASVTTNQRRVA